MIKSTEPPKEVQRKRGPPVNLAKVTLVDESASSVSCTFWANSSAQVNNWAVGDTLEIQGAQVQAYDQAVALNCSKADVSHLHANDSDLTEWFEEALSSQQCFESVRVHAQATEHASQAAHDEIVLQCSDRMFAGYESLNKIRVRCGGKEVCLFLSYQL